MVDRPPEPCFVHTRLRAAPTRWQALADAIVERFAAEPDDDGALFGIWRSQIGRPRDELTIVTTWPDAAQATADFTNRIEGLDVATSPDSVILQPTLRPADATPPQRQGNYAFRWFVTPPEHWGEFLELCSGAWPGFEAAYDSQVIGLWRVIHEDTDSGTNIRSLLLTRRPDLAMWERSKLPQSEEEDEVRRKLSRRYDLCVDTVVYTTTLLTAADHQDTARWT